MVTHELREAYGVRELAPAVERTRRARKRRQAVRTPYASRNPIGFCGKGELRPLLLPFCLVKSRLSREVGVVAGTKITAETIRAMKARHERIASLTAYDFPMARLLDEAGVPLILVGDSLGMVVLGYEDTSLVTLADMEHHVQAAARAKPRALLAADLPYRSYETPESAVQNARRLVAAGAEAVKAEGGREILEQVRAIIGSGIPFLGHLGMLPQHVAEEGGYHIKGKKDSERQQLLADADALVEAGAFAIVLELVAAPVARELTQRIPIPTIGIGAGPDCDGQILVTPDLLGMLPWYSLKHVKPKLNAAEQMRAVVSEWKRGVELSK
jgi:3-methyl-2-oxobutanoate hydroxymethyltransferase